MAVAALIASAPAVLATPASATAAPDPVQALKRQFRPEKGVHITEVARMTYKGEASRTRVSGRIQFAATGPVAFDGTSYVVPEREDVIAPVNEPTDMTLVGRRLYLSWDGLPDGKKWVTLDLGDFFTAHDLSAQRITVLNPSVLNAMLRGRTGEPVSGGYFYQGKVTYADLYRADPKHYGSVLKALRISAPSKQTIAFKLWTSRDGLPTRLMTSETERNKRTSRSIDTRYTDWGAEVIVLAPPADETIPFDDVPLDDPEPKEILNVLPGRARDAA
ncbi:hypothetical protein GCM10023259_090270 [Thermocatellispora tengchongensis]